MLRICSSRVRGALAAISMPSALRPSRSASMAWMAACKCPGKKSAKMEETKKQVKNQESARLIIGSSKKESKETHHQQCLQSHVSRRPALPLCQSRRSARSRTRPGGRPPSPPPPSATSRAAPSALPTKRSADRAPRRACCTPPLWRAGRSWLRSAAVEVQRWLLKERKKDNSRQ